MRLWGAALILTACLGAGLLRTASVRRRMETLRGLCGALELAEGELETRLTPLPELVRLLAGRSSGQTGDFFRLLDASFGFLGAEDFAALWSRAAATALTALSSADREELVRLGQVLGRFELDRQLAALEACVRALRGELEAARVRYPGDRRLSLGLGAAAGALLIVVLM